MKKKPTAAGPVSKTVIGADAAPAPAPSKTNWKKLAVPAGIGFAIYLALKYKGHV